MALVVRSRVARYDTEPSAPSVTIKHETSVSIFVDLQSDQLLRSTLHTENRRK